MNFNIDMIWLDSDKRVVSIEEDVSPDTYPDKFCPDTPAKYVLEINSGLSGQLGFRDSGAKLKF